MFQLNSFFIVFLMDSFQTCLLKFQKITIKSIIYNHYYVDSGRKKSKFNFLDYKIDDKRKTMKGLKILHIRQSKFQSLYDGRKKFAVSYKSIKQNFSTNPTFKTLLKPISSQAGFMCVFDKWAFPRKL